MIIASDIVAESMKKTAVLIILAMTTVYSFSRADTIYLVNGDILSGSIISMSEKELVVKTGYGTVKLDRSKVLYGLFGDESKAVLPDAEKPAMADKTEKYTKTGPPLLFFPFSGVVSNLGSEAVEISENTVKDFGIDQNSAESEAVWLKGEGEYLTSDLPGKLKDADEFTIRVIFKMFNPLRTQYLLSAWKSTSGAGAIGKFAVCVVRGSCILYLADAEGKYHAVSAEGIITPMAWTDLVISVSSATIRIYVNGKLCFEDGRRFGALQKPDIPLHYFTAVSGKNGDDFKAYNLEAYVSELGIWDYALTRQQIQDFD